MRTLRVHSLVGNRQKRHFNSMIMMGKCTMSYEDTKLCTYLNVAGRSRGRMDKRQLKVIIPILLLTSLFHRETLLRE